MAIGQNLINSITSYLDPAKQVAQLDAWQTAQRQALDTEIQRNMGKIVSQRGLSMGDPYVSKLSQKFSLPAINQLGQNRLGAEMDYRTRLVGLLPSLLAMSERESMRGGGGRSGGGGGRRGGGAVASGGGGGGSPSQSPYDVGGYSPESLGRIRGSGYALASNIIGSPNPSTFRWGSGQGIGETFGESRGGTRDSGDYAGNRQDAWEKGQYQNAYMQGFGTPNGAAPDPTPQGTGSDIANKWMEITGGYGVSPRSTQTPTQRPR